MVGQLMDAVGPNGFYVYLFVLMGAVSLYGLWRMTQRAATPVDETGVYAPVLPSASPVAVDIYQEYSIETALAEAEEEEDLREETAPSPGA